MKAQRCLVPVNRGWLCTILVVLCSGLVCGGLGAQTLLVHLELEDNTLDSSTNGLDGTLVEGTLGSSSYIDGPVGKALKLEHDWATITTDKTQGAYVSVPLKLPQEGSLVFWYYVGDLFNYQSLWDTSGGANDWEMWIYQDGLVRGRVGSNAGQVSYYLGQPNSWYHMAYTWKKGDQAHYWVNGAEVDTGSALRTITDAQFDAAILGDTFYLGGGNVGNTFANGAYDDVRIYDAVLDGPAIQAILAEGDPPVTVEPSDPATLLLQWDFEGDFLDSSGNGKDGLLVLGSLGGYGFEAGPVGQALKLNHDIPTLTTDMTEGANVQVPLTLPETGAIALWYRPAPYYNYQNLFNTTGNGDDWEMWIYADGIVRGRVDGNVGQVSHRLERSGEWYHIVYTWWKGGQARIFVNGEERDTSSIIRGISDRQFAASILGDTFFVGGGGGGNTFATGALDDFRVYQGLPTDAEIQALYEAGEPPVEEPPALELFLKLEGDLTDASENGRDGTLVTGSLGSAAFEPARAGQGLSLEHDADTLTTDTTEGAYVSVPLTLPDVGTIALWYYVAPYYNYQSVWDNSVQGEDWEMWVYNDGRLRARVDASSGDITYDLDNLSGAENWYHIAYVWDRVNAFAELYVNGNKVGTAAIGTWVEPGDTFFLGGGNELNTFGVGTLDEVRVYDAALDATAIRAVMLEGLPPAIHWAMDGDLTNTGTLGAAFDGAVSSGANGASVFVPTLYGQGLFLDNSSTALTDGSYAAVAYELTEAGSIALWYYVMPYYNYQSVWDNSVQADDWEMWVYNDGRLRARIDAGSGDITYDLDNLDGPNHWYHIVYTWDRVAGLAGLSINGQNVGVASIGTWINPGAIVYLGGGNDGNTYSNGIFDEVRIYDRVLGEVEIADLASDPSTCPEEGDTHVTSLDVSGPTGPLGSIPGTYTATATATDDSGDVVIYTFAADNGVDPAIVVGPQVESSAQLDLTEGTWSVRVSVDDNPFCDDAAEDAVLVTTVEIGAACPEDGDTHVTALEVTGPTGPMGQIPGTYTATATATDDSGDAIAYTFTAQNGVDPEQVVGPQAEASAQFDLTEGTWTIAVAVDDDECPDVADDAEATTTVEVQPEAVGLFVRGDCNGDGIVDISDPIYLLNYNFVGGVEDPACLAACDANADGEATGSTTDPIYILNHLFLGGPAPSAPYPLCGPGMEETDFALGCAASTCAP